VVTGFRCGSVMVHAVTARRHGAARAASRQRAGGAVEVEVAPLAGGACCVALRSALPARPASSCLVPAGIVTLAPAGAGRVFAATSDGRLAFLGLPLPPGGDSAVALLGVVATGRGVCAAAVDASGLLAVTGGFDGAVRAWRLDGLAANGAASAGSPPRAWARSARHGGGKGGTNQQRHRVAVLGEEALLAELAPPGGGAGWVTSVGVAGGLLRAGATTGGESTIGPLVVLAGTRAGRALLWEGVGM
jgi:hypothetical protein